MHTESAVSFFCHGERLIGILHQPTIENRQGVLVIVGGPQYRAGSHRQFLLLARFLADRGVPVFRFDHRGMGDSEGDRRSFESLSDDILSAIECFQKIQPSLERIALWGLCDAATAATFYAHRDHRINGLVLLNPWVRSETGVAKAYLKHYYRKRLFEAETWRRILRRDISLSKAFKSVLHLIAQSLHSNSTKEFPDQKASSYDDFAHKTTHLTLAERMLFGLKNFPGNILLILSGNDLTADEFRDTVNGFREWTEFLNSPRLQEKSISDADHTFSRRVWRNQVEALTLAWIERQLVPHRRCRNND